MTLRDVVLMEEEARFWSDVLKGRELLETPGLDGSVLSVVKSVKHHGWVWAGCREHCNEHSGSGNDGSSAF